MVAGLHLALSQESMIVRLARVYINLLLVLEALLFASQLVLHASKRVRWGEGALFEMRRNAVSCGNHCGDSRNRICEG